MTTTGRQGRRTRTVKAVTGPVPLPLLLTWMDKVRMVLAGRASISARDWRRLVGVLPSIGLHAKTRGDRPRGFGPRSFRDARLRADNARAVDATNGRIAPPTKGRGWRPPGTGVVRWVDCDV